MVAPIVSSSRVQRLGRDGNYSVLAIDHGKSFQNRLAALLRRQPTAAEVIREKLRIVRHLAPATSGVLCDLGLLRALDGEPVPGLALGLPDIPPAWPGGVLGDAVDEAAAAGCAAVKLCLVMAEDGPSTAQRDLAAAVGGQCAAAELGFILEPVFADGRGSPDALAGALNELADAGADLFKLRIPAAGPAQLAACRQLSSTLPTPWAALSASTPFPGFAADLAVARSGGAAGFVAGAAIWQEGLRMPDATERNRFLRTTAARRLRELSGLSTLTARRIPTS